MRTGNGAASALSRATKKTELIATAREPKLDITKAQGPERGVCYELFVIT